LYAPCSFDTASRDAPVSSFVNVTVTPGMTPLASRTAPRKPPVNVCAHDVVASGTISSAARHHRETRFLILAFLQIEEIRTRRRAAEDAAASEAKPR
jgi:hypothetical protein